MKNSKKYKRGYMKIHPCGGHRRWKLTGKTHLLGVAVEAKGREILREKEQKRSDGF